jgi:hypothetical protein
MKDTVVDAPITASDNSTQLSLPDGILAVEQVKEAISTPIKVFDVPHLANHSLANGVTSRISRVAQSKGDPGLSKHSVKLTALHAFGRSSVLRVDDGPKFDYSNGRRASLAAIDDIDDDDDEELPSPENLFRGQIPEKIVCQPNLTAVAEIANDLDLDEDLLQYGTLTMEDLMGCVDIDMGVCS